MEQQLAAGAGQGADMDGVSAAATVAGGVHADGGMSDHAMIAVDHAGLITGWSDTAERLTGYAEGDVLGRPLAMLGGADASGAIVPGMLEAARQHGSFRQERWWRSREGGLIWVQELVTRLGSAGYVVIGRAIREGTDGADWQGVPESGRDAGRREAALRSELQAAERRAAFLAEASSILVATSLDFESTLKALARLAVSRLADWCVIHSFDGAHQLVRAEVAHRDPLLEQRLERGVARTLHGSWEQTVRTVISTGHAQIISGALVNSWLAAAPGGGDPAAAESVRELAGDSIMITPLMGRGRVLGSITFVAGAAAREYDDEDLTLAEELGRRAAIALDNARLYREAQEANRAKADFLAVISHELRTPLNAIMGYSDLLDAEVSGHLTNKQRRQIDRIRASARHLLQLIEEILSFARIEAGGEEVTPELTDGAELARDAMAVIGPMAASKEVDFMLHLEQESVSLETDPGKARQILVNLLSNAVKFTDRGSVTLSVRQRGEWVVFDVADTGIGIPPEQIAHIFDPFWQAERPNVRRAGGTGLGLAVSRRYVRLLRGELDIQSEPGRGTRASVRLPLRLTGKRATDI
jgi:PAS domain S-box-containing protein